MSHLDTDVIIVGAGPVGLFLACRLAQLGIRFKVLERRRESINHSRSIGIHPPSLERFEKLGIVEAFLAKGCAVPRGIAFANTKMLGTLSFKDCPQPYTFVLTLPQYETEQILEQALKQSASDSLLRGADVIKLEQQETHATLFYTLANDACNEQEAKEHKLSASFIVACDGKDSTLRDLAGIAFAGEAYPDSYLMGDFADTTELADSAGIYLTDEGLVESFPLPNKLRRWVVKTDTYEANPSKEQLERLIKERLQVTLDTQTNSMLSSFGVQHYLAKQFVKQRLLLTGDAAHVLSPIGGQGMNLGWLDAWDAATALSQILSKQHPAKQVLNAYALKRRRAARTAIGRAAFNMHLGRKTRLAPLKYAFVKGMLNSPLKHVFARIFTMRWL